MSDTALVWQLLLLWATISMTTAAEKYLHLKNSELIREVDDKGRLLRVRGFREIQSPSEDIDFIIGGLFPVHSGDKENPCRDIRRTFGMELVEAMLFALDSINADPHLLPNFTLGYDIRDTCFVENVGLDEAFNITSARCTDQRQRDPLQMNLSQPVLILGLVGAAASQVSIPVASLGRLFQVPQISYASTSPLLSTEREDTYTYFFRTIIPDQIQAKALVALVLHFKWNHISIIYSNDAYGTSGRNEIVELAKKQDICIDLDEGVDNSAPKERYMELAADLHESSAEIVIVFALDHRVSQLLEEFTKITDPRRLIWLASDGWSQSEPVIKRFSDTLFGMIGTAPASRYIDSFNEYFSKLTIENNQRNPWFPEFLSSIKKCIINSTCNSSEIINDYQQDYPISRVIEAVYSFAHALQNYLDDNCDQPVEWNRANYSCKGQKRALDGPAMLEYITNVSFNSTYTGRIVQFNEFGHITLAGASYDIVNYKFSTAKRKHYLEVVGNWNAQNNTLEITDEQQVQFGVDEEGDIINTPPPTICKHCVPGQFLEADFSCCGFCSPCNGKQYSNDSLGSACSDCGGYMWGNNPVGEEGSTYCVAVEEEYLKLSHPWSFVVVTLSLLGLVTVSVVTVIFMIYWKTPVIKSSGREQMILLLIGIFLSYMLAFIYVSPPVLAVCIIQRIGLWFCFSLMFGALMVKITRVSYIFLKSTKNFKKVRFLKSQYMVLFTCIVVIGQTILVLGSVLIQYPAVVNDLRLNKANSLDDPRVVISCNRDHLAFIILSLLYETVLILVTTVFGIISFKFPKNFNEAKHISLCTFALAVIWIAFIPSYFATSSFQEFQNATISLAVIISASAILICNFGPRLFTILFKKNRIVKKSLQPSSSGKKCLKTTSHIENPVGAIDTQR